MVLCGRAYIPVYVKAHTHEAIHVHIDRIVDGSPVGMTHWNVHV